MAKKKRKKLTEEELLLIEKMAKEGETLEDMADAIYSTIYLVSKTIKENGFVKNKKKKKNNVDSLKFERTKENLESAKLYNKKITSIKNKLNVGCKVKYNRKRYVVLNRYSNFVVLGNEIYGTSARYEEFLEHNEAGNLIYG